MGKAEEKLKNLPEHENGQDIWFISQKFRKLIDCLPYYCGVLREDRKTVNLAFARGQGYNPEIPIEAYFKGEIHAILLGRSRPLYIPDVEGLVGVLSELRKKTLKDVLSEITSFPTPRHYKGTSDDLLVELDKIDRER